MQPIRASARLIPARTDLESGLEVAADWPWRLVLGARSLRRRPQPGWLSGGVCDLNVRAVSTDILHLPARVVVTAATVSRWRTAAMSSRS
jgi:hypothetical protein